MESLLCVPELANGVVLMSETVVFCSRMLENGKWQRSKKSEKRKLKAKKSSSKKKVTSFVIETFLFSFNYFLYKYHQTQSFNKLEKFNWRLLTEFDATCVLFAEICFRSLVPTLSDMFSSNPYLLCLLITGRVNALANTFVSLVVYNI